MASTSSRALIKKIKDDGWYLVEVAGDHYQFKHPTKKGKVTIPHPKKDVTKRIVSSVLKQAGLK